MLEEKDKRDENVVKGLMERINLRLLKSRLHFIQHIQLFVCSLVGLAVVSLL